MKEYTNLFLSAKFRMVPIDHNGFRSFVYSKFRLLTREVKASISVELLAVVPKKEQIEIKITFTVYAEKITLKLLIAVTPFFLTPYTVNPVKFYVKKRSCKSLLTILASYHSQSV